MEDLSVLIHGIDETTSAVARRLSMEGYAVVLQQKAPPQCLRHKMSFGDAWFDGSATLDPVEARRADLNKELLLGLKTRLFVPVCNQPLGSVIERWPWDVIVMGASSEEFYGYPMINLASLTIGLGPSYFAGKDCHVVIETAGPDIGALIREGRCPDHKAWLTRQKDRADGCEIETPISGLFMPLTEIAAVINEGKPLGQIGETLILAPAKGRVRGLARKGRAVVKGQTIADVAFSPSAIVSGVSCQNQMIARGVAFAIEIEKNGWEPIRFADAFWPKP